MINIKETYGKKYKVKFDRDRCTQDRDAVRRGGSKVSTDDCWYYSIPCKYGEIEIADEKTGLAFYYTSHPIALKIERAMKDKLTYCLTGGSDGMIYFDQKHAKELFKFIHPKTKRHLSEEHKLKLLASSQKYRFSGRPRIEDGVFGALDE